MHEDDMEFITNLDKILSFVDLQKIYETWERDGSIAQKANLLQLGYVSLLSHLPYFWQKRMLTRNLKQQMCAMIYG